MKVVLWGVVIIVLTIGGLIAFVIFNSGGLIKQAIEQYGPEVLGTGVSVEAVELSLTDGTGEVRGLEIENPAGFEGPYAIRIERATLAVVPESLGSDVIRLKLFEVDGAKVATVVKGVKDTNLEALMDSVERNVGSSEGAGEAGAEPKLIIDRLAFTNAEATVDSEVLGDIEVSIPDVVLTDVGRNSNGATIAEVTKQILQPITRAVTRQILKDQTGIEDVKQKLEDKARSALKGLLD